MSENVHVGNAVFYKVWFWLLAITGVEVFLAYEQFFATHIMLMILMALSLVKAGLIVGYFMHLKFERMSLVFSLLPATLLVISLLSMFFPDSYRIIELGIK